MKSAALLPTPGDPFLLAHWFRNYEQVWMGEVDELHVLVNGQTDPECRRYIQERVWDVGGRYHEHRNDGSKLDHGLALNILVQDTDADVLVFVEDDARVRSRGAVASRVERIMYGDERVIASPRTSMTPALDARATELWGVAPIQEDLGQGWGAWPCYLFVDRETLLAHTDRHYGARGWGPGERVPGLDYTTWAEEAADTFGSAALQLHAKVKVSPDTQWKGPHLWEQQLNEGHEIQWFHIGSLSSWGGLTNEVAELMQGIRLTTNEELYEWGHRSAWWERVLRLHGQDIPRAAANYRRNLDRLYEVMGITPQYRIRWEHVIDRMVNWSEE